MASIAADDETDEARLWAAFKDGGLERAKHRLFDQHQPFALSIARRHYREKNWGDLDFSDILQLAYVGLMEAIDRFEHGRGVPFRGYCAKRISGSILSGIAHLSEVREQVSVRSQRERERLRSLSEGRAGGDGKAITYLAEIVSGLAIGYILEGTGLYVGEAEESKATLPSAYDSLAWRELTERLGHELAKLPERERMIMRHHYLAGVGFDQLATLLGLSKGRISQLHRAALNRLRLRLAAMGHFSLQR